MKITIDGRELEAKEGQTILQVAQNNNIYIPTLCYNEAVKAYGACRLCLVEIERTRPPAAGNFLPLSSRRGSEYYHQLT